MKGKFGVGATLTGDTRTGRDRRLGPRREQDRGSRWGYFLGGQRWQAMPWWKRFLISLAINVTVRMAATKLIALRTQWSDEG